MMLKIKKWFHRLCQSVWTIGFIETDIDDIVRGKPYKVKWLDIPSDRWFADPFILDVNDDYIILLVEEWNYEYEKGEISKIVVERKSNAIIDVIPILQLDSHLSFPAIYKKDGVVYVAPENSESGNLNIYKYNESDDSLSDVKCICPHPLTDAIITDALGEKLLFTTLRGNPNGNTLEVFVWKSEAGQFEKYSSVSFNENVARMAGHFFVHDGVVIRPGQVCNSAYGQAVSLQKVTKNGDSFEMEEIRRLYSTHKRLKNGMHTFNYSQGVIVVDAWGWKAPLLRKLFVDDWGNMRNWIKVIAQIGQK